MENLVNKEVLKFSKILVIDNEGNSLGVMSPGAALGFARERNLDLVCVTPNATVPVCKFLNYGKYKYQQDKAAKEAKKKSATITTKEIQLTYTIAEHDMGIKVKNIRKIINEGDNVRIVMRLRGRESNLGDMPMEKYKKFVSLCTEFAQFKKAIFVEGRDIKCILEKKKV